MYVIDIYFVPFLDHLLDLYSFCFLCSHFQKSLFFSNMIQYNMLYIFAQVPPSLPAREPCSPSENQGEQSGQYSSTFRTMHQQQVDKFKLKKNYSFIIYFPALPRSRAAPSSAPPSLLLYSSTYNSSSLSLYTICFLYTT